MRNLVACRSIVIGLALHLTCLAALALTAARAWSDTPPPKEFYVKAGTFGIAASPTSLTIAAGQSGTSTITVTPEGSTGAVTLSYQVSPSSSTGPLAASFNPISVNLSGSQDQTSALTVTVPAAATAGSYTVKVVGTDSAGNTKSSVVSVTVTGGTASFDISLSPDTLTAQAGAGATSQITVAAVNGFEDATHNTTTVSVTAQDIPDGMTCYVFDPTVGTSGHIQGPGVPIGNGSSYTVTLTQDQPSYNLTLTVCACGGGVAQNAPCSVSLSIAGSDTSVTKSQSLAINITSADTGGNPSHGTGTNPPTGPFFKVETAASTYNGLSATVTLPTPNSASGNGSSLVMCNAANNPKQSDSGWFYTGTDNYDLGFILGHSGGSWTESASPNLNGKEVDLSTGNTYASEGRTYTPFEFAGGQITLEGPGHNLAGKGLPTSMVTNTGHLKAGYLGLVTSSGSVFYKVSDPSLTANSLAAKIVESIAQGSADTMNGPGNGFSETGSSLVGGAWDSVTVFGNGDHWSLGNDKAKANDLSYPGAPYVTYSPQPYDNSTSSVTNINVSTVPQGS